MPDASGFTIHDAPGPEPWPAPDMAALHAETAAPAIFPDGVLPPFWARWVAEAAEAAGSSPDYVTGALLAATGALLGISAWGSPWPGWREPPALMVALIGRPSAGKSPAMYAVTSLLARLQATMNLDYDDRAKAHAAATQEAKERHAKWAAEVKEAVNDGVPPPAMPDGALPPAPIQKRRLYSTDPTVAKAEPMSAGNPFGLLLHRDELAGWLAGMDRFSGSAGSDRAFWLQAWGGQDWSLDRCKGGDAEIAVPHLLWSVLGGIQPDRAASLLLAGDDDGLTARFLYSWPEPRPPRRPTVVPDTNAAEAALARLRTLPCPEAPACRVVPFTDAAAAVVQQWREQVAQMEAGASGLFLSWLGKLPGFAVRLAVILEHLAWCASDHDPPEAIGEKSVLRAVTLLDEYAVPMTRRTFGQAALPQQERDARTLARWLIGRRPLPATINAREMRRMADGPGIADAGRMTAALRELGEADWLRSVGGREGGGHGRQRSDWAVNPRLADALG